MSVVSKVKIEDMKVNITYSDKYIDKDVFYDTIVKVIKRIEGNKLESNKADDNKTVKGIDTDGNKTN